MYESQIYNNFLISDVDLLNYVNMNEFDKDMVLAWRNDIRIREKMLTQETISRDSHFSFIHNMKNKNSKSYWLCKFKEFYIGSINLYDWSDNKVWWGYFSNPEYLSSSYGILMENTVMSLVFNQLGIKELYCETLETNTSVLKIHDLFGFKKVGVEGETVIMMNTKNQWNEKENELSPLLNLFRR